MAEAAFQSSPSTDGGYDVGYAHCPCFWGTTPGTLISRLEAEVGTFAGLRVLDAGCGEGKNAAYLASRGAVVDAIDVSELAIGNGAAAFGSRPNIRWIVGDVRSYDLQPGAYDIVVAYGLLHCLRGKPEIEDLVRRLQRATRDVGFNVICAFNGRITDLPAHPGFRPTFLPHRFYLSLYGEWSTVEASDKDLHETHPHNGVPHTHSMSRLIARK